MFIIILFYLSDFEQTFCYQPFAFAKQQIIKPHLL